MSELPHDMLPESPIGTRLRHRVELSVRSGGQLFELAKEYENAAALIEGLQQAAADLGEKLGLQPMPDFRALFQQGAAKLAELAAAMHAVEADLPPPPAQVGGDEIKFTIPDRVKLLAATARDLRARLEAVVRERAHLRQELESASSRSATLHDDEKRRARAERYFFEALRGRFDEREVRDIYVGACEKAASEG